MRTVTLALLAGFTLGAIAPVQAADLDYGVLRGPDYEPEVPVIDWNGIYFGGHGGYTSASLNQTNVPGPRHREPIQCFVFLDSFIGTGRWCQLRGLRWLQLPVR
jgi:opacity protein-like surface antigen